MSSKRNDIVNQVWVDLAMNNYFMFEPDSEQVTQDLLVLLRLLNLRAEIWFDD
jgi:hypothetical protein